MVTRHRGSTSSCPTPMWPENTAYKRFGESVFFRDALLRAGSIQ
jgi:hypothetical protein